MQPYTFTKKDEERENQWKEYSEIFKTYVDFCHNELLKNNDLIFVKEYLKKRNLTKEEVRALAQASLENSNLELSEGAVEFWTNLYLKLRNISLACTCKEDSNVN